MTQILIPVDDDTPESRTKWHIHVPELGTWTDRSLSTASWYDTYEIQPGTYPLLFTTINGSVVEHPEWRNAYLDAVLRRRDAHPVEHPTHQYCQRILNRGMRPYYAVARVNAILKHSHRVNRLLQYSSADDTYPDTHTTVWVQIYHYEATPGRGVLYDANRQPLGTITKED